MTNALHAHYWGSPWIDSLGIFPLTREQQQILYSACETIDVGIVKNSSVFGSLWQDLESYIKTYGRVFIRLSSVSPKDVTLHDGLGPSLCVSTVDRLFETFVHSFRLMEELETYGPYAIILKQWNGKIKADNEYRCFIFNRECEYIAKCQDESEPHGDVKLQITKYIDKHKEYFPEDDVALDVAVSDDGEVIFIEFNPVDNELDQFGLQEKDIKLSDQAIQALNSEPKMITF